MKRLLIIYLSLTFTLTNCKTKPSENPPMQGASALIFGKYHGFCQGDCARLYKMADNQLYADQVKRLIEPDSLIFSSTPMSEKAYQIAERLLADFPQELMKEPEEVIGCPDCADQGGYYLEWRSGDVTRRWRLDTNQTALPAYLAAYTKRIESVLNSLPK